MEINFNLNYLNYELFYNFDYNFKVVNLEIIV